MVDIDTIKDEIVERLKPLGPDKIILFGSHANGTADEDSDIDLFLVNNKTKGEIQYRLEAILRLRDLTKKYKIGFDILSASNEFLQEREDYFYHIDILKKGKVLYAK